MKQVDDTHFVTISLDEDKDDILNGLQGPHTVISSDNKKRKNLENFLGLKDVGPGIPSKKAIEKAAVESLAYQGLTLETLDRNGRKNLSELLGVCESDNKEANDIQGPFSSFYQNAKYFGKRILKYKRNGKKQKFLITHDENGSSMASSKKIKNSQTFEKSHGYDKGRSKDASSLLSIFNGRTRHEYGINENCVCKAPMTRRFPHKLKPNFYVDRNGSLKEKKNISNASIEGALDMPFPKISSSLPIIPFSPNTVPNCDEFTVYTDNQDFCL